MDCDSDVQFCAIIYFSAIHTLVNPEQSAKARFPLSVTELGIFMLLKPEQPLKASFSMVVTELGIFTLVNPVQPLNSLIVDYQYPTL